MASSDLLIDCSELNPKNHGGVQNYTLNITRELLRNSGVNASVLVKKNNMKFIMDSIPEVNPSLVHVLADTHRVLQILMRISTLLRFHRLFLLIRSIPFKKVLRTSGVSNVYTPTTYLNFYSKNLNQVVTLHDIQERDLPSNFSRKERIYRNFRIRATLKYASLIHVSSSFILETIQNHYPKISQNCRFVTVHEGVDLETYTPGIEGKKRQILFPARSWPHKNHKQFFASLDLLDRDNPPIFLLTGASVDEFRHHKTERFTNLQILGHVSDEKLQKLYSESFAVISCSKYESSSLPILEGIAADCVPIASLIPAHVEMSKGLSIQFFELEDPKNLASLIQNIVRKYDHDEIDYEVNRAKIREYSWINVVNSLLPHLCL